jgi:hypothetical protein
MQTETRNSMKIMTVEVDQGIVVEANPLFRNILPVNPCGSRFYGSSGDQESPTLLK